MLKKIIILFVLFSFSMLIGCSDETQQVIQEQPIAEQNDEFHDPFLELDFSQYYSGVSDASTREKINAAIVFYKDTVISIRMNAQETRTSSKERIFKEIEIGNEIIENQEEIYSQKCFSIDEEKQAIECKKIDNIIDIAKKRILELKDEHKETISNINIEEINTLNDAKEELNKEINKIRN